MRLAMLPLAIAEATWQGLVKKHFKGALKPPFNDEARQLAGVPLSYYTLEPE